MNVSVRIRILLGFAVVIITLAAANLISTSGLRGLSGVAQQIAEKTEVVRSYNDFASDITAQAAALKTYAFSGRDEDRALVTATQSRAEKSREKVSALLNEMGETEAANEFEAAAASFDQVFTKMQGRLGNDEEALQVVAIGIGKLDATAKTLVEFLRSRGEESAKVANQYPPLVAKFNQAAIAYVASGKEADYQLAVAAREELNTVIRATQGVMRGVPRRDQRVLRYVRRDADVIGSSMGQLYGTRTGLQEAMSELKNETAHIAALTSSKNAEAEEQQANALQAMVDEVTKAQSQTTIGLLVGAAVAFLMAVFIGNSVAGPLGRISGAISKLAEGDKAVVVPHSDRHDELGQLAQAAKVFKDRAFEMERMAEEKMESERREAEARRAREQEEVEQLAFQKKAEENARQARREARRQQRLQMADAFEQGVMRIVDTVDSASRQMALAAKTLVSNTEQTSFQVAATQRATDEASNNVQAVAGATEELSVSFQSVSSELDQSAGVAQNAVAEASRTTETVNGLSQAADQIGTVVKLIRDIAEQTNLLALNATIEAARAGDAGRGFAVVASEVKNLAAQSGKATEEIASYVDKIQAVSGEAGGAIDRIGTIIGQMNDVTQSVVAAVQQQASATNEITQNVQQVSIGTEQVRDSVGIVDGAAQETRTMSSDLQTHAESLMEEAATLKNEVLRFLDEVRQEEVEDPVVELAMAQAAAE